MTQEPLKPCLVCGGKVDWCDCGKCHQIQCKTCGLQVDNNVIGNDAETLEELRDAMRKWWNGRSGEPVAWLVKNGNVGRVVFNQDDLEYELEEGCTVSMKLYTSPPEREPLTTDRIREIYRQGGAIEAGPVDFARAIEREHGIGK